MSRHASRYRVNGILNFYTSGFQDLFQFVDGVLRLCHGQTVTGYYYDAFRVVHQDGNITYSSLFDHTGDRVPRSRIDFGICFPERAEYYIT